MYMYMYMYMYVGTRQCSDRHVRSLAYPACCTSLRERKEMNRPKANEKTRTKHGYTCIVMASGVKQVLSRTAGLEALCPM